MGLNEADMLLQDNIQEYVLDENKIVTCKWLSLTLSISINSAKWALLEFVDSRRNREDKDDINVTYFVSGFETKECGSKVLKCVVVPETHLETVKQSLSPLNSCHIYSIHKAKLKDSTPLYQADYDVCRENIRKLSSISAISCPWAVAREGHELPTKNTEAQETTQNQTTNKSKDDASSSISKSSSTSTAASSKPAAGKKTAVAANKKGGIASMFAAAERKEKTVKSAEAKSTEVKAKAKTGSEKKGIESFLKTEKQQDPVKKSHDPVKKSQDANTVKKSHDPVKKSHDANTVKKSHDPVKKSHDANTEKKTHETSGRKSDQSQKHKLSDKDEPRRKRRRIRNDLFDSSDEENGKNDDDDDEDEEDIEEEEENAIKEETAASCDEADEERKPSPRKAAYEDEKKETESSSRAGEGKTKYETSKDGKKRKRTRKLVPRQHIDEDGFMVTEKVWESDSTDASDEEVKPPKLPKAASPAKAKDKKPASHNKKNLKSASPAKNKQSSLMSFFKKK